jgi:hypothetical protein
MADNKTQPTSISAAGFLAAIDGQRGVDAQALSAMMENVSKEPAAMWGPSIVGFGLRRYKYESGREGEICKIGFSPRKAALTLYGMGIEQNAPIAARLGKHTTGKGCLYVKKLKDVNLDVLRELIEAAWNA